MILKVGLGFYLFKYRNTDKEDKYMVSIGKFSIFLNANRSNPISKGIVTNFTAPWYSLIIFNILVYYKNKIM